MTKRADQIIRSAFVRGTLLSRNKIVVGQPQGCRHE